MKKNRSRTALGTSTTRNALDEKASGFDIVIGSSRGRLTSHSPDTGDQKHGTRVAEELNKQLPQSTDFIRLEEVTYSDRVLRYSGSLLRGQELNEEFKLAAQPKGESRSIAVASAHLPTPRSAWSTRSRKRA